MSRLILTKMQLNQKECMVTALEEHSRILQMQAASLERKSILGNIYVGQVEKVVDNIHAAFVAIAPDQTCFFPLAEASQAIYANPVKGERQLRPGDQLLVQVEREEMKGKLPSVTSNLSFTGKFLVLTTGNRRFGVSTKISTEDKARLTKWLEEAKDAPYGLIVRTNAATAQKQEILDEWNYLKKRYERVVSYGSSRTCYSLLEEAPALYLEALRDTYTQDLEEIVTDDRQLYEEIRQYLTDFHPNECEKLHLYENQLLPLHKLYNLETTVDRLWHEKVWLKSGGSIVIQQTEAFVSIDVNTGKSTAVNKKKAEEMYRKINLEAAAEIAYQLRLRNLSGIILIDFINLNREEHKEELMHVLAKHLRKDPVKAHVVDITALNIVEVTRKKVHKPLLEQIREL